ncbi:MAG: hypothetical protein KJ655_03035 [Candidatus Thermoplasmatota archaeon]|nr:hypothetical protein [Candidatus Thermoplasmatota archaeon]
MKEKKDRYKMETVNIDDKIFLVGTVQGLTSERKKIKKAFDRVKPDAVALPISEEELEGLKKISDGEKQEILLSGYEEVYAKKLAAHGEVQVPPPALTEAFELSKENSVPVYAVDMNDKEYTEAFTRNVSTIQLILHSLKIKKLRKKRFKSKTPETFVFEWDKTVNKLKGFRALEKKREEYISKRLSELSERHDRILAVIELQRLEGISEILSINRNL